MRADFSYSIKSKACLEETRSAQDTEVGTRAITCQSPNLSLSLEKLSV
jgi:hypothetical protein